MAQPITNPCTMWSGTYYSFASDEPYAHFLVDHLYLTYLYLPFKRENCPYKFPPELRFSTYALHCITLSHSPTVFTCYTMPGDNPLPPNYTLRAT